MRTLENIKTLENIEEPWKTWEPWKTLKLWKPWNGKVGRPWETSKNSHQTAEVHAIAPRRAERTVADICMHRFMHVSIHARVRVYARIHFCSVPAESDRRSVAAPRRRPKRCVRTYECMHARMHVCMHTSMHARNVM